MNAQSRLSLFLSQFLAPTSLVACAGTPFVPPELDDVACLEVDYGLACPDAVDAEAELVGDETCESPVREVIASGEFLYSENFICSSRGSIPCTVLETVTAGQSEEAFTSCCYEAAYKVHPAQSCVVGRPLMVEGSPVSAQAVAREDWKRALEPDVSAVSDEARVTLSDAWERAALLEHASIPAFARLSLDLIRWGAPAALVARTAEAMLDEVRHAEACFALASAYAGRPVGPGGLPVDSGAGLSLERLAAETFREGCVGESLAVGMAAAQLRGATDPAVRATLEGIVADEQRHAALAWDIVRWAIAVGGAPVRRAVEAELAAIELPDAGAPSRDRSAAAHGLAEPAVVAVALRGVLDEVIRPTAAELLAA